MFDSFKEIDDGPDTFRFVPGSGDGDQPTFGAIGGEGPLGVLLNSDDRGVFGFNGKPSLLPGDAGAQITRTGLSWSGLGTPATVTFAFRATAPGSMPSDTAGFTQFNSFQISAALLALSAWSDVANITFNRVSDVGSQYSNNATILFGNYSSGSDGAAAFAFLPGGTGSTSSAGDVWTNSTLSYNQTPVLLQYGQQVLTHEIGHAIGLSHPAAYNASADGVITYGADAIYFEDSRQYTVMSYFSESNTGANFNGRYSSAPLMDDIAAAQRLYGANTTTRTGDTVYGFHSTAGQLWFNANQSTSPLIFCVWDAGGTDTLDFSGYEVAGTIDLRQGAFSSVGGLIGNVSIAIGAVIENAIGGTAADNIRGNSADNRITGNGGADVIDGGLGSDTVVFSGNRADYTVTWNGQTGTISATGQASVTVTNVEFLQFADQTIAAAPTGGLMVAGDITNETITGTNLADTLGGLGGIDTVNGLDGNDTLDGGSGADTLNGGEGADVLIGGLGDDVINGGNGQDVADYSGAGAGVTVDLSNSASSGAAGSDTLTSIEEVRGTTFADFLIGDGNANILRGGGGVDTLSGGGGDDQIFAGAPGQTGGAPDIVKVQGTANGAIGTAVSLAGAFDLGAHAGVANATTIPHATVVATTHGGVEYYAVTVVAGDTVAFDIDNASFDSTLRLFDAGGVELAKNDDSASDGGEETDSGLSFTFSTGGTYYIQVAEWDANQAGGEFTSKTPAAGNHYTLNVSVPSAPVVALTLTGSTLNGEAGADALNGGTGADALNGGDGDDTLNGGTGNDALDGGIGTDIAVMAGARSSYTFSTTGGVTTLTGPDGTDTLTGIEKVQFSDGLFGIDGNPIGAVNVINGTPAGDTLVGTAGVDQINGADGDDLITGAAGNDTIDGGLGIDTAIFSGVRAGYTVSTTGGTTTVTGPDGTDTVTTVERLQFSDATLIVGAGGGQYYAGTAGVDAIVGTAFNDEINGGASDDTLTGGAGNDTIDGGLGTDTAIFSGVRSGYTVNTASGVTTVTGPDGTDTVTTVERLQFSDATLIVGAGGGQYYAGTAGVDTIVGTAFNDQINGGASDDTLTGGAGNDAIDGGQGSDTAVFSGVRSAYTISTASGVTTVTGPDGTDSLTTIERLQFSDGLYDLTGAPIVNTINGTPAGDTLVGTAGVDQINGADGDDLITGAAGNDTIDGGLGTDTAIFSGALAGYTVSTVGGTTTVTGPDGVDTITTVERLQFSDATLIVGAGGGQYYAGTAGVDTIVGTAFNDQINGGASDDTLTGGAGSDAIDGGLGTDTAVFAAGAISYSATTTGGVTTVVSSDGTDTLTGVERLRFGAVEVVVGAVTGQVLVGVNGAETLTGGALGDQIVGLGGADTLDGAGGDDILMGGAGVDALVGGSGLDTADYSGAAAAVTARLDTNTASNDGDGGSDTFSSIENLTGSGFDDLLIGNGLANVLTGGLGRDVILGQGGDDVILGGAGVPNELYGGLGDDTYIVESRTDTIVEAAGEGTDTVFSAIFQINLSANVENLTYTGTGTFTGVGNAIGNTITGGTQRDTLLGLGGDDILIGGAGAANEVYGGLGNDTFVMDVGDTVIENLGEGTDTVQLRGLHSHTLGANVENLTVVGTGDFIANGNALANVLTGGAGNDALAGRAGNDSLVGGGGIDVADYSLAAAAVTARLDIGTASNDGDGGSDTLSGIENLIGSGFDDLLFGNGVANEIWGGEGRDVILGLGGDDVIHGGAGVPNELYGGLGDDTYVVESRADTIVEAAGEGVDTVLTALFQVNLSANVENLTYTGTGSFTGVGTSTANTIRGGTQRDVLLGLGGDDILIGGAGVANEVYGGTGNDYYILQVADTVIENAGEGSDTVEARINSYTLGANIENLIFNGTGAFTGAGNALGNLIVGGGGNDVLRGGGGDDTLDGGLGQDTAVFRGVSGEYTVTAISGGFLIVDTVAGRDGSTTVRGVETAQFTNISVALGGPPAPTEPVAKGGDALTVPVDHAPAPQVLPGLTSTKGDTALTLPADHAAVLVDDGFLLAGAGEDAGPQVLPATEADAFGPHPLLAALSHSLDAAFGHAGPMLTLDADPAGPFEPAVHPGWDAWS